jgi:hypothetical protein
MRMPSTFLVRMYMYVEDFPRRHSGARAVTAVCICMPRTFLGLHKIGDTHSAEDKDTHSAEDQGRAQRRRQGHAQRGGPGESR